MKSVTVILLHFEVVAIWSHASYLVLAAHRKVERVQCIVLSHEGRRSLGAVPVCLKKSVSPCCKILPKTGHEGPEGEWRYKSTPSLTSALDGVGGQRHSPADLPWGKRPHTHCIGGSVGPRAGLDGCGKSRLHHDSILGPSIL